MLPLSGKHILVTREATKAHTITRLIEQQGGISIEIPLLHFQGIYSEENEKVMNQLSSYDWVFFTSTNGIHFFFELMEHYHHKTFEHAVKMKFAVIGEKTEKVLHDFGYKAHFIPDTYTGEYLGKEFNEYTSESCSILVVQGNLAKQSVVQELSNRNHTISTAEMYETNVNVRMKEALKKSLHETSLDIITFTSPSTVDAFVELAEEEWTEELTSIPCMCIGPSTQAEARKKGFTYTIIPEYYTVEGMIEATSAYFNKKG
ncbi:uroporphyrinogen-III synthase [Pontibacillus yanchengensis]|uniref:Uroporphyrinogen-III synthase n=1 Tax=Pontibacillus yanchengensis TaxID=462910 RepID=A0A6I4ZVN2_9BACI|nr:uroporphyrinogen-III synthase [Pontibacillus yanchengensis]MYL34218.1 uroporphyrinogen-III synthase [Pontibacillus yanchengensis]